MLALRQKTVRYAVRPGVHRPLCRYSTAHYGKEGAEHGHEQSGSKKESLGTQLYVVLAVLPACYALYHLSRTAEDGTKPALTRMIDNYWYYEDRWTARNTLHTAMVHQAAFDRNLFHNSKGSSTVDLKFPEVFNTGSPYNVTAGQGGINLDRVVAHYQKKNSDAEDKKAAALAARESEEK